VWGGGGGKGKVFGGFGFGGWACGGGGGGEAKCLGALEFRSWHLRLIWMEEKSHVEKMQAYRVSKFSLEAKTTLENGAYMADNIKMDLKDRYRM